MVDTLHFTVVCASVQLSHTDVSTAIPHAGVRASLEISPWSYVCVSVETHTAVGVSVETHRCGCVGGDTPLWVRRWRHTAVGASVETHRCGCAGGDTLLWVCRLIHTAVGAPVETLLQCVRRWRDYAFQ